MSPSTTTRRPVALVTGASSGIGQATARALLDAGYITYATARRPETLGELIAIGAHALRLDTTDEASMVAAVRAGEAAHGHIDLLVNNAGYGEMGPVRTPLAAATAEAIRTAPDSPYAGLVAAFRQLSERNAASGRSFLTPESVARVIVEAAQARRPRPRYKLGAVAQAMSFLRHALSDRSWDAMMGMMYRPAASPAPDRRANA